MSESQLPYNIMFSLTIAYRKLEDIDALCYIKHSSTAKIVPKGPTSEWHGRKDDDDDDNEMKSSYTVLGQMPVYHFIRIIWQQLMIYTQITYKVIKNNFWVIRSCLLVCSGVITLYCIVWVAILFLGHPYIESASSNLCI